MKKILSIISLVIYMSVQISLDIGYAKVLNENELYSMSACLMDAESGRVLYGKNADEIRPMASTTKIMTCIIALECGNMKDVVKISKYAASMPDVQLNARTDDEFYLGDLLYALMLESHNDVAVAIAEHIVTSVEGFAAIMNEKAKDLGCYDTYFVTPNGLDSTDDNGNVHSTTATDLAKIMAYCIENDKFIEITQTKNHSFTNVKGTLNYSVNNKNAFLDMMEGVISGKTGFTNDAGYCYVAALERDGKKYVISLLGCGWPYNKNYKWLDSKTLFNYGINEFERKKYENGNVTLPKILVKDGWKDKYIDTYIDLKDIETLGMQNEEIYYEIEMKNVISAPVEEKQVVGKIVYYIGNDELESQNIYASVSVKEVGFIDIMKDIFAMYFLH